MKIDVTDDFIIRFFYVLFCYLGIVGAINGIVQAVLEFKEEYDMKSEWQVFKDALCKMNTETSKKAFACLDIPTPFEEIDQHEKFLGLTLPGDYKASLRIHSQSGNFPMLDGCVYYDTAFSRKTSLTFLRRFKHDTGRGLLVDNGIKPIRYSPKRISIAGSGFIEVMIDLDPTPQGRPGQIIMFKGDSEIRVIAPDFKTFFKQATKRFLDEQLDEAYS